MSHNKTSFKEILARIFLRLIPFRILSRLIRFLSRWENEAWKNWIIKKFARRYQINTKEAVSRNLKHYPSFNHFFTREIKPELRPVTEIENGIASPVDGLITQIGKISDGNLIQAKGRQFNVSALLAGESKTAEQFRQGFFATLRLMPEDYHRIHMPLNATLMETVHVPGQLFSIGNDNGDKIPGIVAKNERVICVFSTKSG
ncbi:MAG: archaetidylserine decarboxylase, partial [Gammaproteobacteria bacterium]